MKDLRGKQTLVSQGTIIKTNVFKSVIRRAEGILLRVIRSSFVTERSFFASPPVVDNREANRVRPGHTLRRNNIVINGFLGGQNEDELLATLSVLCDNTMEYMSERTKMLYTYSPSVVRGETLTPQEPLRNCPRGGPSLTVAPAPS